MGRASTVRESPRRAAIDKGLVGGRSALALARDYRVGARAIGRHKTSHLSPALIAVEAKREDRRAGSLTDQMVEMVDKARRLTDRLELEGATGLQLAAMREYRASIETLAKLTGALDERPAVTVNLLASSEIQQLTTLLLRALQPYPEARIAAADALDAATVEATL